MKKNLLIFSLVLMFTRLYSQVNVQNTGILHVSGVVDILYINGSFTNAVGSGLTNRGQLYVMQNLVNGQVFGAVTLGTLHLGGTSLQTVSGSSVYRTFNLVTNNAAGFTLNNDLSVTGTHTYSGGIITTSATPNYLIYESASSYSGEGDSRHVNGWVKKLGSANFSFPVGNGVVIRRAAVESLSGSLEFNAKYESPTPNTTNVQSPLMLIDGNEYWTINRVSGAGSAQVHLNWDDSRVAFPSYALSSIRVAYYTGGLWTDVGGTATGDVNTTGDITSGASGSFGNFTFGSTSLLLPLQFVGITGQHKTGYNLIQWRTASATNTDHFEIERSEDGLHFQKIGTMMSYNGSSVQSYSFKDVKLLGETLWYRVRCVDNDGHSTLSAIVSVRDGQGPDQSMYVLNNPARGAIHLYAPESYKGKCEYSISSTGGQLIQKGVMMVNGVGNVFIKLHDGINPGVYLLHVTHDKQRFQERVLIR